MDIRSSGNCYLQKEDAIGERRHFEAMQWGTGVYGRAGY
jgi:hypothetical protein